MKAYISYLISFHSFGQHKMLSHVHTIMHCLLLIYLEMNSIYGMWKYSFQVSFVNISRYQTSYHLWTAQGNSYSATTVLVREEFCKTKFCANCVATWHRIKPAHAWNFNNHNLLVVVNFLKLSVIELFNRTLCSSIFTRHRSPCLGAPVWLHSSCETIAFELPVQIFETAIVFAGCQYPYRCL